MSRRGRVDVRPFLVLGAVLLVGTGLSVLLDGVLSVLVPATVAFVAVLVAATAGTVARDARWSESARFARVSGSRFGLAPVSLLERFEQLRPADVDTEDIGDVEQSREAS